jgi:hypothetical protein
MPIVAQAIIHLDRRTAACNSTPATRSTCETPVYDGSWPRFENLGIPSYGEEQVLKTQLEFVTGARLTPKLVERPLMALAECSASQLGHQFLTMQVLDVWGSSNGRTPTSFLGRFLHCCFLAVRILLLVGSFGKIHLG